MDIYELVKTETTAYQTRGVDVVDGWNWSMYNHCKYSLLMKNSQFPMTQTKMGERPNKNIIRPILNVAYRSEGFDVKDIEPFVNNPENYYKSFLIRRFHARWARRNDIDTAIDESVETYVDYGGVLVKKGKEAKPEIVSFQQIAFCDQTDILSGTIALKHSYSIDQLKDTIKDLGWYKEAVNTLISNARTVKPNAQAHDNEQKVPDKHVEVFEVHGTFPQDWLKKDETQYSDYNAKLDANKFSKQLHIIAYSTDEKGTKTGVCLYKGEEPESIFKFLKRDPVFGRALGFGGVEELFEAQIWTNNSMIHMQEMLKQASKIVYQTADTGFTTRNNVKNVKNGEVLVHEEGMPATLMNNQAINLPSFEKAVEDWQIHAQITGSAQGAQQGESPASGTPFALQNLVVQTGQSLHKYRQGKIATFWGEIYRDWILPELVTEMNKGDEWIDELSLEEMQNLSETVMHNVFNDYIIEKIIAGEGVTKDELAPLQQQFQQEFKKSNKKFLTIVKNEFKEIPIDVEINIVGKQKDLAGLTEKLTEVFKTIIANPQILQLPSVAKIFNKILESAGLDQIDFSQDAHIPSGSLRETMNFKDLPPDGQVQMAARAGFTIQPPQQVAPVNTGQSLPVTK